MIGFAGIERRRRVSQGKPKVEKHFTHMSRWRLLWAGKMVPLLGLHSTRSLLCIVNLEDASCSIQIDDGSIDDHLVLSGIGWDGVHIFNVVSVGSKSIDEEVDVYHI